MLLVVGPSGSGKSTLAAAITGRIPVDVPALVTGQLDIDDRDIRTVQRAELAGRIGVVVQDADAQLVMERAEDDVAFGLENRAWSLAAMRERVPETLGMVGLQGLGRHRSWRLSGGQRQRLALAGALAPRPGLLVLDEPTANVDPDGAGAFMAELARLRSERSTTIVLIDHLVESAWPLADVVLALDGGGRTIDVGPAAEVGARSATKMRDAGIWLPAALESSLSRQRTGGPAQASVWPDADLASPTPPSTPPSMALTTAPTLGDAPILTTHDLRFLYRRGLEPAIRDVRMAIRPGERVALVGPNGSGKSTLARLLVGLLRPTAGSVRLLGDDPARITAADLARRAGFVFQDPERQFLAERVDEEITLGLGVVERRRAGELMDALGLPLGRFGARSPYRLSGGEQRRLSLACGLVRFPRILVLDEPTFSQDRRGYDALLAILAERVDQGAAIVTATHDRRFVADLATRVIELDEGWIVADDLAGDGAAA